MIERKKVVIVAACAALVLLIVGTVAWWLGRGGGGGSEQGSVQSYKEELKAKFNGAVVSDTEKISNVRPAFSKNRTRRPHRQRQVKIIRIAKITL